jgi:small subunit ribosomal protein S6
VATKPAYDLLVLIDANAPEERREQILTAIRKQIDSGEGELKSDVDWGVRKLAFEIEHRGDAYYHLFQLESAPELLKQLEHNLAIDDAVLRHRIIRLHKGVQESPPRPSPSAPPRSAQATEGEAAEVPVSAEPAAAPSGSDESESPHSAESSEGAEAAPREETQPAT